MVKVGIHWLEVDSEVLRMEMRYSNVLEIWGDSAKKAMNRNQFYDKYHWTYFIAFIEFSFFECIDIDSGI